MGVFRNAAVKGGVHALRGQARGRVCVDTSHRFTAKRRNAAPKDFSKESIKQTHTTLMQTNTHTAHVSVCIHLHMEVSHT